MYSKKNKKKEYFISLALIFVVIFTYIFVQKIFDKDDEIYIDVDNTEKIIDQKDLEEVGRKLDELDINLDDILKELDI
jgi:hypothetical protein